MDEPAKKQVEKLLQYSNNKYVLLEGLLKLTLQQADVINEDSIEALEELVDEKQKLIDQISRIDEGFNTCFSALKKELGINSLDELQRCSPPVNMKELQAAVGKIMELLTSIAELEERNGRKAKELFDSMELEIKKINTLKKAASAYNPPPVQSVSHFIDKKK